MLTSLGVFPRVLPPQDKKRSSERMPGGEEDTRQA